MISCTAASREICEFTNSQNLSCTGPGKVSASWLAVRCACSITGQVFLHSRTWKLCSMGLCHRQSQVHLDGQTRTLWHHVNPQRGAALWFIDSGLVWTCFVHITLRKQSHLLGVGYPAGRSPYWTGTRRNVLCQKWTSVFFYYCIWPNVRWW